MRKIPTTFKHPFKSAKHTGGTIRGILNESQGMSLTCPKCGSSRIHRSHRRTLAERLSLLLAAKMKRCHECNFRFVQLYGATLLLSDLQRSVRKLAWTGVIVMALLAVLAIVVWFSNKQAAYTPSP